MRSIGRCQRYHPNRDSPDPGPDPDPEAEHEDEGHGSAQLAFDLLGEPLEFFAKLLLIVGVVAINYGAFSWVEDGWYVYSIPASIVLVAVLWPVINLLHRANHPRGG